MGPQDEGPDTDRESRDSDTSLLLGNAARVRVTSLKVVGSQMADGGTLRKPYLEYQLQVTLGNQVRCAIVHPRAYTCHIPYMRSAETARLTLRH
jgi:hypothetical protein